MLARGSSIPLSVCELFEHLPRYNGKRITVTGPIINQHAYMIGQVNCRQRFVTRGFKWPWVIAMTTAAAEFDAENAPFSTDRASLHALDLALIAAKKGTEIWVTVTGELRLKKHYHAVHTNYGVLGDGYGHLGAAPALLVIERVDHVELKNGPNAPVESSEPRSPRD